MHELSICRQLLKQLSEVAAQHPAAAIDTVYVQVGPLSGVEPDLLQSAFPVARKNTVAASAELVVRQTPIRIKCRSCSEESDATLNNLVCPACGDWHTQLLSGDELMLERVEFHTEH